MPREKVADPSTAGRYAQVSWRRRPGLDPEDQGTSPGFVQVATINERMGGGPADDGWHVDLDEAGIDRLIKALHKAKNQAFGGAPLADSLVDGPGVTVESDASAAARLDVEGYERARRGDR